MNRHLKRSESSSFGIPFLNPGYGYFGCRLGKRFLIFLTLLTVNQLLSMGDVWGQDRKAEDRAKERAEASAVLVRAEDMKRLLSEIPVEKRRVLIEPLAARERIVARGADEDEAAEDSEDKDEILASGPLTDVADSLGELVSLDWNMGQLAVDCKTDRTEVSKIVSVIRQSTGGGGMSSSSSSNGAFSYSFSGQRMSGIVQNKWPANSKNGVKIHFNEMEAPKREFSIENDENSLSVRIIGGDDPFVLHVRQQANGQFSVQDVNMTEVFATTSPDFGEFCREHVEYAQTRLLPLLRKVGLNLPPTPQDKEVQTALLRRFTPIPAERLEAFRERTKDFDSPQFEVRERVSRSLLEDYADYSDIIERVITDESFSAESRSRLLALFQKLEEPKSVRVRDVIDRLDLDEDIEYLVWLLGQQQDSTRTAAIVEHLETLTNETFGDNLVAWQTLVEDSKSTEAVATAGEARTSLNLFSEEGPLTKIESQTATLVRLHRTPNGIGLDRELWKEQFNGKSLTDLNNEVKEEIRKRGLPDSFYRPPSTSQQIGYPHVLFESFYQELRKIPHTGTTHYRSSGSIHQPNRTFAANGLDCSLATSESNQVGLRMGGVVKGKPDASDQVAKDMDFPNFNFSLSETDGPQRRLLVDENKEGQFRLEIGSNREAILVRLIRLGEERGWLIQDIRGNQVFTDQADSFDVLYQQHQGYFDEEFFPTLAKLGVKTDLEPISEDTPAENQKESAETEDNDG